MGDDESRPDPSGATTAGDFMAGLRALRVWCGLTYRQVEAAARANGDVLPHSTVATALARKTLPREELVTMYVRACGADEQESTRWLAARRRLAVDQAVPVARPRRMTSRVWRTAAGAVVVVVLSVALQAAGTPRTCADPLHLGDGGLCVKDLQVALQRTGLALPADGRFGPYTKMRVVAFQQLTGLPPTGIADQPTMDALARPRALATWSPQRVEQRVREVFPEEPDRAVRLVDCLSRLDPLWIYGRADKTRDWGLFQLNDREVLFDFRSDHTTALDPESNIGMARAVWRRTGDFSRWHCESAPVR
ncbi:peptidoglycan-binding domain-containing protein [Actinosynnema sp. NPDC050436]|uniref:peptidoglycan-binding domain-containing protein n=1 Tax=Actinosynnema sp. NPDC050436 TaxID=3155659 RepID=UPI0033D088D3